MSRLLSVFAALWLSMLAPAAQAGIGFQRLTVEHPDGDRIEVGVWYPASAPPLATPVGMLAPNAAVLGGRLPLIVISWLGRVSWPPP